MPLYECIDLQMTGLAVSKHLNLAKQSYREKAQAACLGDMSLPSPRKSMSWDLMKSAKFLEKEDKS